MAQVTSLISRTRGYEGVEVFSENLNRPRTRRLRVEISNALNVVRMPVQYPRPEGYHYTYLPNIANAADSDMAQQLELFYEHIAPEIADAKFKLSKEDYVNLRTLLPLGAKPFADFLVCTLAPSMHEELGITPGKKRSLLARFDNMCDLARLARAEAVLRVAGRPVKSTGELVKNVQRAVEYQMKKTLESLGELRDAAHSSNATERSILLRYPDLKEVLYEIARSGIPSYKVNNDTPVDEIILSRAWGGPGGKIDHFHEILSNYMVKTHGTLISRSATASLMEEVGIKNLANANCITPVLAMHYCANARVFLESRSLSLGFEKTHAAGRAAPMPATTRFASKSDSTGDVADSSSGALSGVLEILRDWRSLSGIRDRARGGESSRRDSREEKQAAAVKMVTQIFDLFGAWSVKLSIDAKSLYKCNCSQGETKDFQIVSERSRWGKPDHSCGNDMLGKLGLFSTWLLGTLPTAIESLREAGAAIVDAHGVATYDEDVCFGERTTLAYSFAHVEDEERESAPRNMHDVDRLITTKPEYFLDPEGSISPFFLFHLDNAHGFDERPSSRKGPRKEEGELGFRARARVCVCVCTCACVFATARESVCLRPG